MKETCNGIEIIETIKQNRKPMESKNFWKIEKGFNKKRNRKPTFYTKFNAISEKLSSFMDLENNIIFSNNLSVSGDSRCYPSCGACDRTPTGPKYVIPWHTMQNLAVKSNNSYRIDPEPNLNPEEGIEPGP